MTIEQRGTNFSDGSGHERTEYRGQRQRGSGLRMDAEKEYEKDRLENREEGGNGEDIGDEDEDGDRVHGEAWGLKSD